MNTAIRGGIFQGMLLTGALALPGGGLMGCDEPLEPEKVEAKASAAKTAEPAPVAVPAPAPEPVKVKKKLEDCEPGVVNIDHEGLEAAIRLKAQKPEGKLGIADLKKLRSLNLARVEIEELDICLFHHMTELRELFIGPTGVDDLSPIAGSTKIETLGFAMNPISDLSPLKEMTKMDRLDMANTKVTDLSPLSGMTVMTELTLDGSPVEDVSALHGMTKLERLSIKGTKVKDIKFLEAMKDLKFIYINDSPIADDIGQTGVVVRNGGKVVTD